jgi:hypothetical protein
MIGHWKYRRPRAKGAPRTFLVLRMVTHPTLPGSAAPPQQNLRASPRFRRLTERVHKLGPRPCAEVMLAAAAGRDLMSVLSVYAEIDEQLLNAFQGRTWPPLSIARVA